MASQRRPLIGAAALAVASFVANAGVFVVAYNRLATPFLQEEQRVENADAIFIEVAPAYALVSVLVGAATYLMLRRTTRH